MAKGKGGKSLNPADAQRKLDRKRDIKRCKKQRVEVRKAVLKNKDHETLIEQMTKIDEMAYDPHNPSPLPTRVLDEKRQRIRETVIRMLAMHKRDVEWDEFNKVRAALRDYDLKKKSMEDSFQAVKFAKEADPMCIPMPDGLATSGAAMTPVLEAHIAQHVPKHLLLPSAVPSSSILKRTTDRRAPGPPVGLPPPLSESEDDDDDYEKEATRGVRFADDPAERQHGDDGGHHQQEEGGLAHDRFARPPPPPMGMPPMGGPQMPFHPNMGGHQPQQMHSMNPNRQPLGQPTYRPNMPMAGAATISAAPSIRRAIGPSTSDPPAASISQQPASSQMFQSKPVMRNMRAEVTKLVPTAVKVKRAAPTTGGPLKMRMIGGASGAASRGFAPPSAVGKAPAQRQKPMTDDAYAAFMSEMKDLL